jgi:CRP-like cAMP-binding protein
VVKTENFVAPINMEQIARALPGAKIQQFTKGIVLLREGRSPGSCYFILKGRVEIRKRIRGRAINIANVGRGEFFGEMSMLSGEKRSASAIALTSVKLIEIRRIDFERLLREHNPLAVQLSLHFATQLANRAGRLLKLLSKQPQFTLQKNKTMPVDVRQVLHQVYSLWAV